MGNDAYHHGKTIRKYREMRGLAQRELAEKWPKADGGTGVELRYVQMVEAGDRYIANFSILHKLCDLLEIPRWEFGLSEYNPFDPNPGQGKRLYNETLDAIELLINQSLVLWKSQPLPIAERSIRQLVSFLDTITLNTPPAHLERRFHSLRAHCRAIIGLLHCENNRHRRALEIFESVHTIARSLNDPVLIVHLLVLLGGESKRVGKFQDAINTLEEARDHSFHATKHLAAFANARLAHAYACIQDMLRFERTIAITIDIARSLNDYGDGTDFVHQRLDDILVLRSSGYLRLGRPRQALDLLPRSGDKLHVYRAHAHLMLNDIESCIEAMRDLVHVVTTFRSPHRTGSIPILLQAIDDAGYADLPIVKQFKEELRET